MKTQIATAATLVLLVALPGLVAATPPESSPVAVFAVGPVQFSLLPGTEIVQTGKIVAVSVLLKGPTSPECLPVLDLGTPVPPFFVKSYNEGGYNGVAIWELGTNWQFVGSCP